MKGLLSLRERFWISLINNNNNNKNDSKYLKKKETTPDDKITVFACPARVGHGRTVKSVLSAVTKANVPWGLSLVQSFKK